MSVITHRQFVSVVRKSGYGNSEKMTDLLGRLNLKNRIIDNLNQLSVMMREKIDYPVVDVIITEERTRTYNYLKEQISQVR